MNIKEKYMFYKKGNKQIILCSLTKKYKMLRNFVHIICILFFLVISSCSSLVTIDVKKFYKADMIISLYIEQFFSQYLFDLLGATTLKELLPEEDLRGYLESIDAITDIAFEYHDDLNNINIIIATNNVIATMQDLNIIYDKKMISSNMQEFKIKFSRSILLEIISGIPKYNNDILLQSFFPNKLPFADTDYAEYLAWAMSDYGDQETIKKQLESSYTRIAMKKEQNFGVFPDKNWQEGMGNDIQFTDYFLMDLMNKKNLQLSFTF